MRTEISIIDSLPSVVRDAPLPIRTSSYSPVGHANLLNFTQKLLQKEDYQIVGAQHQHASEGKMLISQLQIIKKGESGIEFEQNLAVRNSYNKQLSVGYASGAINLLCLNGVWSADTVAVRKHTTNVIKDIQGIAEAQILGLGEAYRKLLYEIEMLKVIRLGTHDIHRIVGEAFLQDEMITTTQIRLLRQEIKQSEHFAMDPADPSSMNAWNLESNFTETFKLSHPTKLISNHRDIHHKLLKLV